MLCIFRRDVGDAVPYDSKFGLFCIIFLKGQVDAPPLPGFICTHFHSQTISAISLTSRSVSPHPMQGSVMDLP